MRIKVKKNLKIYHYYAGKNDEECLEFSYGYGWLRGKIFYAKELTRKVRKGISYEEKKIYQIYSTLKSLQHDLPILARYGSPIRLNSAMFTSVIVEYKTLDEVS
jgi:hypothetical protein